MDHADLTDTARLQQAYTRRIARNRSSSCVPLEAILDVLRREGPEETRLATLDHVMACPTCHQEYQWLSAVDQAALEAGGATAGAGRPWWRGAPAALAASLAAAVGAAFLVRSAIRSGPELERGAGGDIALVAPARGAAVAGPITFVWRALPGATGYVLEVQRPDGAVAFADTTSDTTFTLTDAARVLTPEAEYRWWVRERTEGGEPRSSALRPLRP